MPLSFFSLIVLLLLLLLLREIGSFEEHDRLKPFIPRETKSAQEQHRAQQAAALK